MSFFWNAYLLALKGQLRSRRTWLLVLLLPLLTLALAFGLPSRELSAPVQVGICLPKSGAEAFRDALEARSGSIVTFVPAQESAIEAMVATGQWDCGLILPRDFQNRLESLDTDDLVTFYIGPGSTVYPLVQEAAATAILDLTAPVLAQDYLDSQGLEGMLTIRDLAAENRVELTMTTLSGRPVDAAALAGQEVSHLLTGCIGLFLLIWALFSAMDLGAWLDTPAAHRMGMFQTRACCLLPRSAAALSPALFSGAVSACLLRAPISALAAAAAYWFLLWAMALLLSRHQQIWSALPVLMPFLTVLALLMSPVLLDLSAIHPVLGGLSRILPLTLYLNATAGQAAALVGLFAEGLGFLLLFFFLENKKRA